MITGAHKNKRTCAPDNDYYIVTYIGELKEGFECKKYLHGVSDMGSKLLFRFRSGIRGLNEELGRHSIRSSSKACFFSFFFFFFFFFVSVSTSASLSVENVLWEYSEYSSIRKEFIRNLDGFFTERLSSEATVL